MDQEGAPHAVATDRAGQRRVVVPQWVQLVALPLAILFGWLFASAASHAVLLFVVAGLISMLLNPVVRSMTRTRVPRALAVLVVFTAFSLIVAVASVVLVNVAVHQTERARANLPRYVQQAKVRIDRAQSYFDRHHIDYDIKVEGQRFLDSFETTSLRASRDALSFGRDFIGTVASTLFNIILVVVITVYMLLDAPRIGRFVSGLFPAHGRMETLFPRLEHQLFNYVRGQIAVSLVMGASAAIGLWVVGAIGVWPDAQALAIPFGLIVAVTEVAPSIGPVLGAIPPVATALFYDPWAAVVVAIFFTALHQLEGHVVIPRLMGSAVGVHPLVIIFGMLAGVQILGIGGIILVLPLLAVGSEAARWLGERLELQRWSGTGDMMNPVSQAAVAATLATQAAQAARVADAQASARPEGREPDRERATASRPVTFVSRTRAVIVRIRNARARRDVG